MNQTSQIGKAETFRKLHNGSQILILANAWDVASPAFGGGRLLSHRHDECRGELGARLSRW